MPPAADVDDLIRAGMADHNAGRLDAAEATYRRVLAVRPDDGNALHLLGLVAHQTGRSVEAIDLIERATRARPDLPVFWFNLGTVLTAAGDHERAAGALATAVRLDPNYAAAYLNLANACHRLGRLPEVVAAYTQLVRLMPANVDVRANLAGVLWQLGQWGPAVEAYRQALAIDPAGHEVRRDLAAALNGLRRSAEAAAEFRRLLADAPAAMTRSYHSNYLLCLQYTDAPPAVVLAESERWALTHAAMVPPPPVHLRGRRVRVGYVSPDLRDHPVGRLIEPLLAGHDRDQFEVVCYSDWRPADAVTNRLRSHVERWHETGGITDAAVAEQIAADGIDLLVDLAGHTAHNRMGVFARRPAATAVSYLGYPATTGLAAIDYRLTDAVADPPGETDAFHTERLVRVPGCFVCFAEPSDTPPVAPPPVLTNGYVTFGSFNAAAKVGPSTVRLWAAALTAVPRSRLAIKALGWMDAATRDGLLADLAAAGVSADRVDVLPTEMSEADHLARYGRIDVALDPFPYHGTMTTLDAVWMGVPTVTLAGATHVSRVGATLMRHAGLGEYVASSVEQFAAIAAERTADVARLAEERATMRDRLRASPLMDARRYVAEVESAYDAMVGRRV